MVRALLTTKEPAMANLTHALTKTHRRSRSMTLVAATLCTLGAAGAITGIVLGSGSSSPHHQPAAASSTVTTLQRELGVLNYYDGPDDGIMNRQTKQAITYLQRQSGLPQT